MTACGFREKEPQINADERRYEPVMELGAAHRKVRKERKAQPQCGTPIQRIFIDPRIRAIRVPSRLLFSEKFGIWRICVYLRSSAVF